MSEIKLPDYRHYTRVMTITAEEANELLAHIQLRGEGILDPDKYNARLEEERIKASSVLFRAFDTENLNWNIIDENIEPYGYNEGRLYFIYANLKLDLIEFCSWAANLEYDLPEEFATLATHSASNKKMAAQSAEPTGKTMITPATDNARTVEGLLKMVFAMAKDCYGYDPQEKKNTATAKIVMALEKLGLSLCENTIRTRLKQAELLLPRDHEVQKNQ